MTPEKEVLRGMEVTSREGRVSRNERDLGYGNGYIVTSREGRVSRNSGADGRRAEVLGHVPRGACE